MSLDDRARAILNVEARLAGQPVRGQREAAARELGLSPTHYALLLSKIIDTEAALAHDAVLVNRLRRQRAARSQGARSPRRREPEPR